MLGVPEKRGIPQSRSIGVGIIHPISGSKIVPTAIDMELAHLVLHTNSSIKNPKDRRGGGE